MGRRFLYARELAEFLGKSGPDALHVAQAGPWAEMAHAGGPRGVSRGRREQVDGEEAMKRKRVPPNMAAQVLLTFGSDCWLDMPGCTHRGTETMDT